MQCFLGPLPMTTGGMLTLLSAPCLEFYCCPYPNYFLVIRSTMSGRDIREVAYGMRRVSIILEEEVKDKGFRRLIDAIGPAFITQTVDKVMNAFSGSTMLAGARKLEQTRL